FGSPRIGLHGKSFKCWKFRSMVVDADERLDALLASDPDAAREWAETQKLRNDPRITAIGRFLRKSSIDELPQLVNVIRGEMSLVGPRPVTRGELTRYDLNAIHYLLVRPGVTGPWQVSGRSNSTYEKRVQLDKTYALRRTFWSDALLLVKTVPAVLFGRGAV
ncbi:MAG: sugar transferase, partial [Pseudomonadota bacterium]